MELNDIRLELNKVDAEILDLLEKRYDLVTQVAEYKASKGMAVFDASREEEILNRVNGAVKNRAYAEYICDTYQGIMESSRNYQAGYLENIILIGMPGCGKSTIGSKLAAEYGYTFVDADEEFTSQMKMTPAECISRYGEPEFRKKETAVLESFRPFSRRVIATGGGVVTVPDNYEILKPLGLVFYIKRDLDRLTSKGRPLSASRGVEQLYAERADKYELWADEIIDNNGTPAEAVRAIGKIIKP